jgi:signal transduction histidine kinase
MSPNLPPTDQRRPGARVFVRSKWRTAIPAFLFIFLIVLASFEIRNEQRARESRKWIDHTYDVRDAVRLLDSNLFKAQANYSQYLLTGDANLLDQSKNGLELAQGHFDTARRLTADNNIQQGKLAQLELVMSQMHQEIRARPSSAGQISTEEIQAEAQLAGLSAQAELICQSMLAEEMNLLGLRRHTEQRIYYRIFVILGILVAAALIALAIHVRFLLEEIKAINQSQALLQESRESYRGLSAKLLEMRDQERRKIARELHDSVGQYLAMLRMNLGRLAMAAESRASAAHLLPQAMEMADRAIVEVRTISHLLHPPLLEEIGLASAIRAYADEFSRRSNIQATVELPEDLDRLPKEIELALFRTVQEGLTNVHRHSGAKAVEISLHPGSDEVSILIRDNGKGLRPAVLAKFHAGVGGGVGLSGMRERLAELGGQLEVESSPSGTLLRARMPTHCDAIAEFELDAFGADECSSPAPTSRA